MVEAFSDDAKASVGAMMPAILLGDVFAVAWFHRHADWPRLWGLTPYVATGMALGALACLVPVGAILGIWLLRIIPQGPFDVLALFLAGLAAVRLIVV